MGVTMHGEPPMFDERMNAYLDGELDADDRAAFERELAADERLRAQVDRLRAIESGLGRLFPPDATMPAAPPASSASSAEPRPDRRAGMSPTLRRVIAYAAIVVLAGVGWMLVSPRAPAAPPPDAEAIYQRVGADFVPDVLCDTPPKFIAYTRDTFGVSIAADFDAGVELLGWTSQPGGYLSDAEPLRILLARAPGGVPVIAVFQRAREPDPELKSDERLRMFDTRVGGISVHEITPLDRPVLLDLLSISD